jgi:ribosome recycling factor
MLDPKIFEETSASLQKAILHLKNEFSRLHTGRANVSLLDAIRVDSYGTFQPLKNIANISVLDAKTLQIQPWDKSLMQAVEKAILEANLGLNPINKGTAILIAIPSLTEERRKDLVKIVHKLAEDAKIAVRQIRQDVNTKYKTLKQDNIVTEDEFKLAETKVQGKIDIINKEIDDLMKAKELDVMTV